MYSRPKLKDPGSNYEVPVEKPVLTTEETVPYYQLWIHYRYVDIDHLIKTDGAEVNVFSPNSVQRSLDQNTHTDHQALIRI